MIGSATTTTSGENELDGNSVDGQIDGWIYE